MKRRALAALPALLAVPAHPAGPPAPAPPLGPVTAVVGPPTVPEGPAVIEGNLPAFYELLKQELTFPLAWGNSGIRDFGRWREAARAGVEEALCQPPDRTPFAMELVDEVDAGAYRRRRILFNVTRHSRVRATMLVPHGSGPFPAALLLHDHGSKFDIGKEKLIQPWYDEARLASARAWAAKYFTGRFIGDELAARGYLVLAVDALGWGDRGGLGYDGQQALASNFVNLGGSLAGLLAREDVRAAALLASLREVDRRRIAAVGFSMGGYRAWQVAALSRDIAATVSICWMTTVAGMMVPGNNTLRGQSAWHLQHPGLTRYLDIPDVASISAPRPALFFDGELDPLFTPTGVADAYAGMRAVWRSQRADANLTTRIWPGLGHVFVEEMQQPAFDWLVDSFGR